MPKQNTTPPPEGAGLTGEEPARPVYRVGDVIVFKYEGNVRAEVTGRRLLGGKLWVEARAADLDFLVPAHAVVGTEPKEVA
jgi:hypothetical protein